MGHGPFSGCSWRVVPVLEALIRVHLSRKDYDQLDQLLHDYLTSNKDPESWEHVVLILLDLHLGDSDRNADFFERLFMEVPQLVGSHGAARLLADALQWSEVFVDGQLDCWRESRKRNARQAYGEIVAAALLMYPDRKRAKASLEEIIENRDLEDARAGAALTAANFGAMSGNARRRTES